MSIPLNPLTRPVDKFVIANRQGVSKRSPGVCELFDAKTKRKWDQILTYGATGSFSRFIRVELAEPYFELTLADDQDWADWDEFKPLVLAVPKRFAFGTGATGYLDIDHPFLAEWGIRAVGIQEIAGPDRVDDTGLWKIAIHMIEWKGAPRLSLAKPEASAAQDDDDPQYRKAVNAAIGQIQELSQQLSK